MKAINIYQLIQENDKIAVCISGGKDSFLMAKCFQEIKRHGIIHFEVEFIVMNPGYSKKNLKLIQHTASSKPICPFQTALFFTALKHFFSKAKPGTCFSIPGS